MKYTVETPQWKRINTNDRKSGHKRRDSVDLSVFAVRIEHKVEVLNQNFNFVEFEQQILISLHSRIIAEQISDMAELFNFDHSIQVQLT